MIYAEAAYFDGIPVQHVADWLEQKRRARIERAASQAYRQNQRNAR